MKKLLNTLYVLTPESYLTLENSNVIINVENKVKARIPLITLESIVCFNYAGASPQLVYEALKNKIGICFFSPTGKFLYRAQGSYVNSNIIVREIQYNIANNESLMLPYIKNMLIGKLANQKRFLYKFSNNHNLQVDQDKFNNIMNELSTYITNIQNASNIDSIRAYEGKAAQLYFSIFDDLILRDKETFYFKNRNRRPPLDPVNALLSLTYTILSNDCANALESVGLDPYCGFMHVARSGRKSLSLDLVEEFRPILADRFVISLINNRIIIKNDFYTQESGAVYLTQDGRAKFFQEWQKQKQQDIMHPFIKEKINYGLLPYSQALLLSRTIRNDLTEYPVFFYKS